MTGLPRLQPKVYMMAAEASEMVMSKHWLRRLHTALVALALALVPLGTAVNAADDLHKVAVVAGRRQETLTPARLAGMLNATHVRYRAVVISACYSGVFIPRLANPNSLVVTAADANHSSFGCEDRARP